MRHREDPSVIEYLNAENAYTSAVMASSAALQETLYAELVGRIQETDTTAPEPHDAWFYYLRTETGLQYPIVCRRRNLTDAPEEVVLDQNAQAVGLEYYRASGMSVSPDHRRLAWGEDVSGSEEYVLRVKDLVSGAMLSTPVEGTSGNVAWAADGNTLFYVTLDETHRPSRVFRRVIDRPELADALVYEERDEAFWVGVELTRSKAFILIEASSHATSETRYAPADEPDAEFRVVRARRSGVEYDVGHREDRFYLVTNEGATNFQLVTVPVADPAAAVGVGHCAVGLGQAGRDRCLCRSPRGV